MEEPRTTSPQRHRELRWPLGFHGLKENGEGFGDGGDRLEVKQAEQEARHAIV